MGQKARSLPLKTPGSMWSPDIRPKSRTPIAASPESDEIVSGVASDWKASGAIRPNTDGPKAMPTTI